MPPKRLKSKSKSKSKKEKKTKQNPWIQHVLAYAETNKCEFCVALKKARASYKQSLAPVPAKAKAATATAAAKWQEYLAMRKEAQAKQNIRRKQLEGIERAMELRAKEKKEREAEMEILKKKILKISPNTKFY